ncbi:hypothetical protein SAMN05216179_2308 [Gracilibacillus kekensis]|uniref:DUF4367 domain-containing protein n=2 Tax=Gracilibacillus kekensis TaxID=1027249 RepID=A0A1M7PLA1_9BACI|nr:hypothetical protein SAMN05216179_2308 [Gracilibacillus kekensis]
MFLLLIMSACTSEKKLDTRKLEVAEEDVNILYKPVDKKKAEVVLPYEIEYPTYFPFEHEETNVAIVGWEDSNEKIVTSIRYPSIEEDDRWNEGSIYQPAIPNVNYTVANFDRYYSEYADMNGYDEIKIGDDITGLFKLNKEISGAELHWFDGKIEYNLQIMYYSEDTKELEDELIKIANSI